MTSQASTWTILITDDDPLNREILKNALTVLLPNISLQEAANGEQAVSVVNEQINSTGTNFNLIFMDYQMPLMNGQEATRAIRKSEATNQLAASQRAYIITWSAAKKVRYEGADAIIAKPLQDNELRLLLEEYRLCKSS